MNAAENYVNDMLKGIYAAHPDELEHVGENLRCLINARKHPGKVAIVTGGGSAFATVSGYVGEGMLEVHCRAGVPVLQQSRC